MDPNPQLRPIADNIHADQQLQSLPINLLPRQHTMAIIPDPAFRVGMSCRPV